MLFNSFVFLFAFLPISVLVFHLATRFGRNAAALWLVLISFVFYGWWKPAFVIVLVASIAFNFGISLLIEANAKHPTRRDWILGFGIATSLAALFYYKYLVALLGAFGLEAVIPDGHIELPLGISFFTFTQIGYLLDVRDGTARERGLLNYVLFVTFFPHLIAGPILHHQQVMPQFADPANYRFRSDNLGIGLTIFFIGLAKKCLFADPLSADVQLGFENPAALGFFQAWGVALSYMLQLYFDFSGYSDMAIGLARMFNIRFPLNFASPYKARSIIDFWQRWHITLTRYLTLCLYNPLALRIARWRAARRLGPVRTPTAFLAAVALPTMYTMGLAGIWHGAGLQFLIFGLLHGAYLVINHAWRTFGPNKGRRSEKPVRIVGSVLLTYGAVVMATMFFRAASVPAALDIIAGLIGLHGFEARMPVPEAVLPFFGDVGAALQAQGVLVPADAKAALKSFIAVGWLIALYGIVWGMPNTQQIMVQADPALGRIQPTAPPWLQWRLSMPWAVAASVVATLAVLSIGGTTEFLYFQF